MLRSDGLEDNIAVGRSCDLLLVAESGVSVDSMTVSLYEISPGETLDVR